MFATMLPTLLSTLSAEECFGITLVLLICTTLLAPRQCQSFYYTVLACYHGLVALLARTEVFIFLIFLSVLVEDVCNTLTRAIKPWVIAKLSKFGKSVAQASSISTTHASIPLSTPANNQLRSWIKEDAEKDWKSIADKRKQEAQRSQELRDSYRELASEAPEHEIPNWSLYEMEERGKIGL